MGDSSGDRNAGDGEVPRHDVTLAAFSIDATAVTNEAFAAFVDATGYLTEAEAFGFSAVFHRISYDKIGTSTIQSRATAGIAGTTFVFVLPGSPGACKDAWDGILATQLDYRYRPCNFVEIMPRLDEHLKRGKLKA